MKPFAILLGIALAAPAFAVFAAGTGGSYQALLQKMPALPSTPEQAMALWVQGNRTITEGRELAAAGTLIEQAQTTLPGAQTQAQQIAQAQQGVPQMTPMVQYYSTPKGQAELQAMPLAQKMAIAQQLSQQMNPNAGRAYPVSDADGAALAETQPYAETQAIQQKIQANIQARARIEEQWRADEDKIEAQQAADAKKIPICNDEAAEPDSLKMKNLALSYVPKHVALTQTYLAKYPPLLAELKAAIAPEVAHADQAVAALGRVQSPRVREQAEPSARAAASAAVSDISFVLGFVRETSERAARAVARKADIEAYYGNAQGC